MSVITLTEEQATLLKQVLAEARITRANNVVRLRMVAKPMHFKRANIDNLETEVFMLRDIESKI